MIANEQEYGQAKEEHADLEQWLARLQTDSPIPAKGLTIEDIRKLIARVREERGAYEGSRELDGISRDDSRPFRIHPSSFRLVVTRPYE